MLQNPQISWHALAMFSRSMAQMLEAGVDVRKSLTTSALKSSDSRLSATITEVSKRIGKGDTLADALGRHSDRFPPLFRDLVNVGEQTGAVPEVFSALSRYYESRLKQVRDFRSAIAWPVLQLIMAVMIIGLLIFILGILPSKNGAPPVDILGLGLVGTRGAIFWFASCFGITAGGFILYKLLSRNLGGQLLLHPILMRIPVIGGCMRSFAISRFAWCFALTQQAGMSIQPSLECSLKATANGVFILAEPNIWNELNQGETFADALASSQLFPSDFLQFVETAEQTGTVPEQMHRMSHIFEDNANRALQRLASVASTLVWLFVAGIIIYFIFRIFMLVYMAPMNDALQDAMR
jgi:type IV pilus assembly protein PilC